jgi:autotransporter-associated beta strand protein
MARVPTCVNIVSMLAFATPWNFLADSSRAEWIERLRPGDVSSAPGDAFGFAVGLTEDLLLIGSPGDNVNGSYSGSALLLDRLAGSQIHYLTASDGATDDLFGQYADIDGNRVLVGALGHNNYTGAAYLFDATTGQELFKLTASDGASGNYFGFPVGINGTRAVIGAPANSSTASAGGAAYLFDVTNGLELFRLESSDIAAEDGFGWSVGISGNRAVVGAPSSNHSGVDSGSAYIFDVTTGSQLYQLTPSDIAADDGFGEFADIDGNVAIVSSLDNGGVGAAYLFDVTTGLQLHKLTPLDPSPTSYFGQTVSISGNLAVVGAWADDDFGTAAGAAYVFDVTTGQQLAKLTASDATTLAQFGRSHAILDNTIMVGAPAVDDINATGTAYLFEEMNQWIQTVDGNWNESTNWSDGIVPNSSTAEVFFGEAVSNSTIITVDADITVSRMTFDNSTYSYALFPDLTHALTLGGEATIDVVSGLHVIAAPLAGTNGLTKTGDGELWLFAANSYSGETRITGGKLVIEGGASLGDSEEIYVSSSTLYANNILFESDMDVTLDAGTLQLLTDFVTPFLRSDIEVSSSDISTIENGIGELVDFQILGNLTGDGTLHYETVDPVETGLDFQGDNSGFNGTIFVNSQVNVGFAFPTSDLPNAVLNLAHPDAVVRKSAVDIDQTIALGGLVGVAGAQAEACSSSGCDPATDVTYLLGSEAGAYDFAGDIVDTTGGYGVNVAKVGTNTQIFSGNNSYTGPTTVAGGKLVVNGTHTGAGNYEIWPLGTLGGIGTIEANVTVDGTLAPGNSPGIITIDGDYTQSSAGTLEIEVAGLIAGTEHDQIIITGTASLAGELRVPILNGFTPQANDEVTFLTAGLGVNGEFNSLSATGLQAVNPTLAIEIHYQTNDVRLKFVAPSTTIEFDGQQPTVDWNQTTTWTTNTIPTSTDVIELENLVAGTQRVEIQSADAFVHELQISSMTDPITLAVMTNKNLSATNQVTIGDQGIIELDTGTVVTETLLIDSGGLLTGNGVIRGSVIVGHGGSEKARISPGFSPGEIVVDGDLEIGRNGEVVIELEGVSDFDKLEIMETASLGGTLSVSVPVGSSVEAGDSFEIITADDLLGTRFTRLVTDGTDGYFIALDYEEGLVALSTFNTGDMNRSGGETPDQDDVPAFALALTDPASYFNQYGASSDSAGDIDGDGDCDVDDIDNFADLMGMPLAELQYHMQQTLSVPEPGTLILLTSAALIARARRCRILDPR